MLVQHFALRAAVRPLPVAELDALTVQLLALTPEVRSSTLEPDKQGQSMRSPKCVTAHATYPALRRCTSDCRPYCGSACKCVIVKDLADLQVVWEVGTPVLTHERPLNCGPTHRSL